MRIVKLLDSEVSKYVGRKGSAELFPSLVRQPYNEDFGFSRMNSWEYSFKINEDSDYYPINFIGYDMPETMYSFLQPDSDLVLFRSGNLFGDEDEEVREFLVDYAVETSMNSVVYYFCQLNSGGELYKGRLKVLIKGLLDLLVSSKAKVSTIEKVLDFIKANCIYNIFLRGFKDDTFSIDMEARYFLYRTLGEKFIKRSLRTESFFIGTKEIFKEKVLVSYSVREETFYNIIYFGNLWRFKNYFNIIDVKDSESDLLKGEYPYPSSLLAGLFIEKSYIPIFRASIVGKDKDDLYNHIDPSKLTLFVKEELEDGRYIDNNLRTYYKETMVRICKRNKIKIEVVKDPESLFYLPVTREFSVENFLKSIYVK